MGGSDISINLDDPDSVSNVRKISFGLVSYVLTMTESFFEHISVLEKVCKWKHKSESSRRKK